MDKIDEKIEYMIEKYPDKVLKLAKYMHKQDPEMVEKMLDYPDDADHIASKRKYDELVERIKWHDGDGRGAKWNFEDIKKNSRINFSNVDYTEFDYAYLVNMLYAKCHKYISDPSIYLKLAKCLLEDRDEETKIYRGSYYNQKHYKQQGIQDHYDDFNEENRRYRRYRNEMNDFDNRYDNGYENRRHYSMDTRNDGNFFRQ